LKIYSFSDLDTSQKFSEDSLYFDGLLVGNDPQVGMGVAKYHFGDTCTLPIATQYWNAQVEGIGNLISNPVRRGAHLSNQGLATDNPVYIPGIYLLWIDDRLLLDKTGHGEVSGGDAVTGGNQGTYDSFIGGLILAAASD